MPSPGSRLCVGVAGVGRMGLRHVDALLRQRNVDLCAVADPSDDALGRALGLARAANASEATSGFRDAEQMLDAGGLDCVIIATPPEMHASHCLMALELRVPTLVEKPLAMTIMDGRRLVAEAERTGVLLQVGHIERFNPVVGALRDCIRDGLVGAPISIEIWRHGPAPERPCDEGVALDLAIHDLDLVRHVLDDEPVLVEARPSGQASIVERLDAQIELQSGGRASLSVGWDTAARERRIVVVGESGTIEAD
ncbi:MAG: Gfo/Idh/MocA family oxidoreductase, partial [Candidatus Limnocylindrales bacterium]